MIGNAKFLVFPGAFQLVRNYKGYEGVDIWLKSGSRKEIPDCDCFIGHSLGANFVMTRYDSRRRCRFILVNPLIKKLNIPGYFLRLIKFFIFEGTKKKKLVPVADWPYAFKKTIRLLRFNAGEIILKVPKEDVVIIRGKKDNFFCDEEAVRIITENDIPLIEVEAGHNWNGKITEAVNKVKSLWSGEEI